MILIQKGVDDNSAKWLVSGEEQFNPKSTCFLLPAVLFLHLDCSQVLEILAAQMEVCIESWLRGGEAAQ